MDKPKNPINIRTFWSKLCLIGNHHFFKQSMINRIKNRTKTITDISIHCDRPNPTFIEYATKLYIYIAII